MIACENNNNGSDQAHSVKCITNLISTLYIISSKSYKNQLSLNFITLYF